MNVNFCAQRFNYLWAKNQTIPDNIELISSPNFKDFNLDYSLESLERIDAFLDVWREEHNPSEENFKDSEIFLTTLYHTAFYCAEVIARTTNSISLQIKLNM